jgi:hypothetical protein
MQYETACSNIRGDIARLLLELRPPSSAATYFAARATRDITDALHHAAGRPGDPRWSVALGSLATFLERCNASPRARNSQEYSALRRFVGENDLAAAA